MRTNLVILLLCLIAAASVVAEDAYYQESIDENVIVRTTRLDNDSGGDGRPQTCLKGMLHGHPHVPVP